MENTKLFDESIRKLEEVFPLDSNNYKNFIIEFHNLLYGEKFESNDLSSEFVDEVHFSNVDVENYLYNSEKYPDKFKAWSIENKHYKNIDIKIFFVKNFNKKTLSWIQNLTINFEDGNFANRENVGIDICFDPKKNRILLLLSNKYILKSYEIRDRIKPTDYKILKKIFEINAVNSSKREIHEKLWESLDLAPLNKDFYEKVKEIFNSINKQNTSIKNFELFSAKLVGRIIFLWFLKEKGMIAKSELEIPNEISQSEFYFMHLKKIFNMLDDKESNHDLSTNILYLGSSIFEVSDYEYGIEQNIEFGENFFNKFFGFLNDFNFTTDENTSDFEQVAIDPEMLGQIFENLLAEINTDTSSKAKARNVLGAFYTPRDVVDFMCRNSLLVWFKNQNKSEKLTLLFEALLEPFDKKFKTKLEQNKIVIDDDSSTVIINSLSRLKIIDPACGSGAFPIGMLQVLLRVHSRLPDDTPPYKLKIQYLQNTLFGVDIDPIAVEISKLRALLTIVIESNLSDESELLLPNLEFNYICANTLGVLTSEKQSNNSTLFYDEKMEKSMAKLRQQYFSAEISKIEKKKKRKQFFELINQDEQLFEFEDARITKLKTFNPFEPNNSANFFDSEIMLGEKDFDIVIGNPPYVSFGLRDKEKLSKKELEDYKFNYPNSAEYKVQIYPMFMEKALNLTKKGGVNSFIVTDTFLVGRYFSKIRNFILNTCSEIFITFALFDAFKATVGFSIIYHFLKETEEDKKANLGYSKFIADREILSANLENYNIANFSTFKENQHGVFRFYKSNTEEVLFKKIEHNSLALGDAYFGRSALIYKSKDDHGNKIDKEDLLSPRRESQLYNKILTSGGQVKRLDIEYDTKFIEVDPKKIKSGYFPDIYKSKKVFLRQTGDNLIAALDDEGYYAFNNLHIFSNEIDENLNYYLAAYLNSKICNFYYQIYTREVGRVLPQIKIDTVYQLPIINNYKDLNDEVKELFFNSSFGTKNKLDDLNSYFYNLYSFSQDEIDYVEENTKY